jgi:hypothetical protein
MSNIKLKGRSVNAKTGLAFFLYTIDPAGVSSKKTAI